MRQAIVCVHDRALDAFLRPFYVPALGAAIREFQDEINNPQSPMNKHPEDYDLYHLGFWDDATAKFTQEDKPIQIAIGKQLTRTNN